MCVYKDQKYRWISLPTAVFIHTIHIIALFGSASLVKLPLEAQYIVALSLRKHVLLNNTN